MMTVVGILMLVILIAAVNAARKGWSNPVNGPWCPHCGHNRNRAGYRVCQRCHRDRGAASGPVGRVPVKVVRVEHRHQVVPPPAPPPPPTKRQRLAKAQQDLMDDEISLVEYERQLGEILELKPSEGE